jgi:hypothetical protein
MKAKLIKTEVNYLLENKEGVIIASTSLNKEGKSLSKQNCDEIFGVVDVEKLAMDWRESTGYHDADSYSYILGFNKAMELNKDKVFTAKDMENGIDMCIELMNNKGSEFRTHKQTIIQSLQQPIEVEVEIEMYDFELPGKPIGRRIIKPKLDSEGCLILKKI